MFFPMAYGTSLCVCGRKDYNWLLKTTFFFAWTSIMTKCNLAILNCVSIHQIRSHAWNFLLSWFHFVICCHSIFHMHTILTRWSNHDAFPSFTVADLIFMMIWYIYIRVLYLYYFLRTNCHWCAQNLMLIWYQFPLHAMYCRLYVMVPSRAVIISCCSWFIGHARRAVGRL